MDELVALIDEDPEAAGKRAPAFRKRLVKLNNKLNKRIGADRHAEAAELLGIAKVGATNGDFSRAFSDDAVEVLARHVGLDELIALIDQRPDNVGERGPRFRGRLAALRSKSGEAYEAEAAELARIAKEGATKGEFTPIFSAAAVETLERLP